MKYQHILYEKENHVARIILNRPEVLNAIQPITVNELVDAFMDFIQDENLWVAILTGSGDKAFCVGADLKYRASTSESHLTVKRPIDDFAALIDQCNKPIIAAVNGYAIGGGLELALRCDIIIAAEHAQFGLPEVKIGLAADAGGLFYLPKRIPYHQAMGMILTGKFISAQDAFRMGLVNEVVPGDDLKSTADSWAQEIIECAPLAVQAAKRIVRAFLNVTTEPDEAGYNQLTAVQKMRVSQDYLEGSKAFAEKRKPKWQGK